ncbi:uncharacterized protein P884DRAFT_72758 [Thermothelomyces heterothallicus CBS 202.75]|uniref:uncharacterized protein n=1 Tax=Thermothelomyces heterothallicus CBS 202.75 TaxID=1149848 RepID=UPI003743C5C7
MTGFLRQYPGLVRSNVPYHVITNPEFSLSAIVELGAEYFNDAARTGRKFFSLAHHLLDGFPVELARRPSNELGRWKGSLVSRLRCALYVFLFPFPRRTSEFGLDACEVGSARASPSIDATYNDWSMKGFQKLIVRSVPISLTTPTSPYDEIFPYIRSFHSSPTRAYLGTDEGEYLPWMSDWTSIAMLLTLYCNRPAANMVSQGLHTTRRKDTSRRGLRQLGQTSQ